MPQQDFERGCSTMGMVVTTAVQTISRTCRGSRGHPGPCSLPQTLLRVTTRGPCQGGSEQIMKQAANSPSVSARPRPERRAVQTHPEGERARYRVRSAAGAAGGWGFRDPGL